MVGAVVVWIVGALVGCLVAATSRGPVGVAVGATLVVASMIAALDVMIGRGTE